MCLFENTVVCWRLLELMEMGNVYLLENTNELVGEHAVCL